MQNTFFEEILLRIFKKSILDFLTISSEISKNEETIHFVFKIILNIYFKLSFNHIFI